MYKQKYLKYKIKYLLLKNKNKKGGALNIHILDKCFINYDLNNDFFKNPFHKY